MSPDWFGRHLQAGLLSALGDTPVVSLAGAPRTGKSALVQALGLTGVALADPATHAEAAGDPAAFLKGLPALAVLEDLDRVPALVPRLKTAVAEGQRFLLTASRTLPGLVESLAGDLESFTLWPLAQAEREGTFPGLIDACFQGDPSRLRLDPLARQDLLIRVLGGGYPEVADLSPSRRESWFHAYLAAMIQGRMGVLTGLREVHHLIRPLVLPVADPGLAKRCGDLLEDAFVMAPLRSGALRSRCFNDSALQAHILGLEGAALETRPVLAAPLLETFAVMELVKTAPWSGSRPTLSRLRAGTQDLIVLEDRRRRMVAFAVSATATVQAEVFEGLQALRDQVGERLAAGIVLHGGGETRAAGAGLWVLPFQALWAPVA